MKKIIILLGVLLLAAAVALTKPLTVDTSGSYQTQNMRPTEAFDTIMVSGPVEVGLAQTNGTQHEISLSGPESLLRLADIRVQDNTLWIGYKQDIAIKGDHHLRVSVVAPAVQKISVSDRAELVVPGELLINHLTIQANTSSEVEIASLQAESVQAEITGNAELEIDDLTCQMLQIKAHGNSSFDADKTACQTILVEANNRSTVDLSAISTDTITVQSGQSAEVKLKGKAASASLIARGRSGIRAGSLQVDKADVMAENSAHIDVRVQDTLNAQAQGRGAVEYRGWPKSITRIGRESAIYPIR